MSITLRPLGKHIGVELVGLDLSQPLAPDLFAEVRDLLIEHSLLLFRGQSLTPKDQVRFSGAFGELELHPLEQYRVPGQPEVLVISNVFRNGQPIGLYEGDEIEWHVDQAPTPCPSMGAFLYCVKPSEEGGETWIAAPHAAYEALSEATKARIDGLRALHSMAWFSEQLLERRHHPNKPPLNVEERSHEPDVVHPLVRTNPDNGRKSLFVGSMTIREIEGLDPEEGRALVRELLEHTTRNEFVYRHKWRRGDLLCWDNRSTIHTATPCDRHRFERIMHRTSVKGTRPG